MKRSESGIFRIAPTLNIPKLVPAYSPAAVWRFSILAKNCSCRGGIPYRCTYAPQPGQKRAFSFESNTRRAPHTVQLRCLYTTAVVAGAWERTAFSCSRFAATVAIFSPGSRDTSHFSIDPVFIPASSESATAKSPLFFCFGAFRALPVVMGTAAKSEA